MANALLATLSLDLVKEAAEENPKLKFWIGSAIEEAPGKTSTMAKEVIPWLFESPVDIWLTPQSISIAFGAHHTPNSIAILQQAKRLGWNLDVLKEGLKDKQNWLESCLQLLNAHVLSAQDVQEIQQAHDRSPRKTEARKTKRQQLASPY